MVFYDDKRKITEDELIERFLEDEEFCLYTIKECFTTFTFELFKLLPKELQKELMKEFLLNRLMNLMNSMELNFLAARLGLRLEYGEW